MSGRCETTAAKATSFPCRKIGVTVVTSWMCPEPFQGSLVMNTSPSRIVAAGYLARKCRTVAGRQPMNPGRLMFDCASERPCASVRTIAKSLPSRTSVEKQVRTNAAAASSTTLIRRFHRISSSMALKFILENNSSSPPRRRGPIFSYTGFPPSRERREQYSIELLDHQGDCQIRKNGYRRLHGRHDGALALFQHQRAFQRLARRDGIAVIDRHFAEGFLQRQINLPLAQRHIVLLRRPFEAVALALRAAREAPGDHLRLRAWDGAAVQLGVVLFERLHELRARNASIGKSDRDVRALPEVAHVGAEEPLDLAGARAFQLLLRLGLQRFQLLRGFVPVDVRDELRRGVRLVD